MSTLGVSIALITAAGTEADQVAITMLQELDPAQTREVACELSGIAAASIEKLSELWGVSGEYMMGRLVEGLREADPH